MEEAPSLAMLEEAYVFQGIGSLPLIETVSASVVESLKCYVFVQHAFRSFAFEARETRCLNIVCASLSIVYLLGYAIETSCGSRA